MKNYLEFERDIKDLDEELEKLKDPFNKEGLTEVETEKISKIQSQIDEKLKTSYVCNIFAPIWSPQNKAFFTTSQSELHIGEKKRRCFAKRL